MTKIGWITFFTFFWFYVCLFFVDEELKTDLGNCHEDDSESSDDEDGANRKEERKTKGTKAENTKGLLNYAHCKKRRKKF